MCLYFFVYIYFILNIFVKNSKSAYRYAITRGNNLNANEACS